MQRVVILCYLGNHDKENKVYTCSVQMSFFLPNIFYLWLVESMDVDPGDIG
jgi:hypothetical protein